MKADPLSSLKGHNSCKPYMHNFKIEVGNEQIVYWIRFFFTSSKQNTNINHKLTKNDMDVNEYEMIKKSCIVLRNKLLVCKIVQGTSTIFMNLIYYSIFILNVINTIS